MTIVKVAVQRHVGRIFPIWENGPSHVRNALLVLVLAATVMTACSADGGELAEPVRTTENVDTSVGAGSTSVDGSIASSASASATVATPEPSTSGAAVSSASPTFALVEVPEAGVPGLDSLDQFCAAWSRFGGSFQVVSVASAFLVADPQDAFGIEVAAAPVVTSSFARMLGAWPAELESEFDTIGDIVFGPFAARSDDAMEALAAAGATDDDTSELADAWVLALSLRDPTTPEVPLELDDRLQTLVDAAAVDFADSHTAVFADPALVNEVATPLTDQYLAVSCPDQGTLTGGEVGG